MSLPIRGMPHPPNKESWLLPFNMKHQLLPWQQSLQHLKEKPRPPSRRGLFPCSGYHLNQKRPPPTSSSVLLLATTRPLGQYHIILCIIMHVVRGITVQHVVYCQCPFLELSCIVLCCCDRSSGRQARLDLTRAKQSIFTSLGSKAIPRPPQHDTSGEFLPLLPPISAPAVCVLPFQMPLYAVEYTSPISGIRGWTRYLKSVVIQFGMSWKFKICFMTCDMKNRVVWFAVVWCKLSHISPP